MGTKNNPGRFDPDDSNIGPDEPFFMLLGRDEISPIAIRVWAECRERILYIKHNLGLVPANDFNEELEKIQEARHCASQMYEWRMTRNIKQHELKMDRKDNFDDILHDMRKTK